MKKDRGFVSPVFLVAIRTVLRIEAVGQVFTRCARDRLIRVARNGNLLVGADLCSA